MKTSFFWGLLTLTLCFTGCSGVFIDKLHSNKDNPATYDNIISQEVVIGDELIYGDEYSFENVYKAILGEIDETTRSISYARSASSEAMSFELCEDDIIEMVYFSVQPSTVDSLKLVNEKMGFLNPFELDRDIVQACDPDKLIFKTTEIQDIENVENCVNFETKYYYIVTKTVADEISSILESFCIIEDFEVLTENAIERISVVCQDYSEEYDYNSRGIFSELWSGIKKTAQTVANAVSTATQTVVDFIIKPYEISGTLIYTYDNQTLPAYGVNVKNVTICGNNYVTDNTGKFNLGSRTDSAGLCFIWLDYENDACKLTNFLGVTASTLVKTALPSYLQNVTITSNSDYANAKMAIYSDMYSRYKNEAERHSNIPKAIVWTTELGNGTSSSPAFHYRGASLLPDIILTGVTADSKNNAKSKLLTLHHEYTHFLHCTYTKNKNNFWDNVVLSEIGCTIANATVEWINEWFNQNLNTGFVNFYNFKNPYVYFAENYAEWYSLVGFYGKGVVGKNNNPKYASGLHTSTHPDFYNQRIFAELVKIIGSVDEFVNVIDNYDVTTFNELYKALITEYPLLKTKINNAFQSYYIQEGSKTGNLIDFQ